MNKSDFSVIKKESINLQEWQDKHPKYYAVAEKDTNKPGYGWILVHGIRPCKVDQQHLDMYHAKEENIIELKAKIPDLNARKKKTSIDHLTK